MRLARWRFVLSSCAVAGGGLSDEEGAAEEEGALLDVQSPGGADEDVSPLQAAALPAVVYAVPDRPGGAADDFERRLRVAADLTGCGIVIQENQLSAHRVLLRVMSNMVQGHGSHASFARELRVWVEETPGGASSLPGASLLSEAGIYAAARRILVPTEPAIVAVAVCPICGAAFCGTFLLSRTCPRPRCGLTTHFRVSRGARQTIPQLVGFYDGDLPFLFRHLLRQPALSRIVFEDKPRRADGIISSMYDTSFWQPEPTSRNDAGMRVFTLDFMGSLDGVNPFGKRIDYSFTPVLLEWLQLGAEQRRQEKNMALAQLSVGPKCPRDVHAGMLCSLLASLTELWKVGFVAYAASLNEYVLFRVRLRSLTSDGLAYPELKNLVGHMAEAGSPLDFALSIARESGSGRVWGVGVFNARRYLVKDSSFRRRGIYGEAETRERPPLLTLDFCAGIGKEIERLEAAGDTAQAAGLRQQFGVIGPSAFSRLPYEVAHLLGWMHIAANVTKTYTATLSCIYPDSLPAIAFQMGSFRTPLGLERAAIDALAAVNTHRRPKSMERAVAVTCGALKAAVLGHTSEAFTNLCVRLTSLFRRFSASTYPVAALAKLESDAAELWVIHCHIMPETAKTSLKRR